MSSANPEVGLFSLRLFGFDLGWKVAIRRSLLQQQGYLVFGFNFGFRLQMLTFFRNIASTARSYRGKNTHIYKVNMYN